MTEWETIEDNEGIKAEFRGYREGLVRLKEGGWALLPTTAAMIDTYKVTLFIYSLTTSVKQKLQLHLTYDFQEGKIMFFTKVPHSWS